MDFIKVTEQVSQYRHLERMTTEEVLTNINREDKTVPYAIEKSIPDIVALVDVVKEKLLAGGRLFYIGAGTSGRLGVLDASECPPTYGVSPDLVIGIMAGGDQALRYGIEEAEDDEKLGWTDLQAHQITRCRRWGGLSEGLEAGTDRREHRLKGSGHLGRYVEQRVSNDHSPDLVPRCQRDLPRSGLLDRHHS